MFGWISKKNQAEFANPQSSSGQERSIAPEIFSEIRRINFLAQKQATQGLFGKYKSAFKGQGIEFEELRSYVPGDDVRSIHWGATARSLIPQVKRYREERELQVILAIDVSASQLSGTGKQLRSELLASLGATLATIALTNNDKIGLLTYSNKVETYIAPQKKRGSTWQIIHEVLYPNITHGNSTNIAGMCEFLTSVLKRRSIIFILSDFIDLNFRQPLAILARRHDVSAFVVKDPSETSIPSIGLVRAFDPEHNSIVLFDTSDPSQRSLYLNRNAEFRKKQQEMFAQLKIPQLPLLTNQSFTQDLRQFFDQKSKQGIWHG